MKETLKSHLLRRDAELTIQESKSLWDTNTYNEAIDAWSDISLKVMEAKNEDVKQWYQDRLTKIHTVFRRQEKLLFDLKRMEVEYQKLYDRYQDEVEVNKKLEELHKKLQEEFKR